jgi:cysteinyl-tRNA synthetase
MNGMISEEQAVTLKLYNTRTKAKEAFSPLDPARVRMYVCGLTVYDLAHIGNARPIIVFDLLFRLLRHVYGEAHVVYARNITDVDDKINARAAERGISIGDLTAETIAAFHDDIRKLGVLMPDDVNAAGAPPVFIEPRATEHIAPMIALIERLIERGHAYAAEGHVLFHVPSDPNYGSLARRPLEEMRAGARIEVAPYKRDPMDFVLWKPSGDCEPGWDTPFGYGRPGWHLECSAMAKVHLGEVFDIHGGGIDLVFPHHENEVAQSTCAHGTPIMAQVWMHNGHLQVEGAKMSKSLGNFVTIRDVLADWPGAVIRVNMLRTHYRQPMDWTVKGLEESHAMLRKWQSHGAFDSESAPAPAFMDALSDDLNTPQAMAELHRLEGPALGASLALLGLETPIAAPQASTLDTAHIESLIEARLAARAAKNWAEADRIRDELSAMGLIIKDGKDPQTGKAKTEWEPGR